MKPETNKKPPQKPPPKNGKRISLYPLKLDDALRAALLTPHRGKPQ
ncbi:MAG: hypothetical protein ABSG78_23935 [Verrucomicrobiota bacterium]|jgi:hypothetical protein